MHRSSSVRRDCSASAAALLSLLLLCGCATLENVGSSTFEVAGLTPATKVYDLSQNLIEFTNELSREEEYYLGRAVAARIMSIYPPHHDPALHRYVNSVGAVAAAFSTRPNTFGGYHFQVLDSMEVNAMAAPGGFVFITRGMLELLPDEDALAAVLAHEVGHITERHGIKAISQQHLNEAMQSFGELAGSLNCAEVLQQATVVFKVAVDDVVATLLERGYGRAQERAADRQAVLILQRAGYDPRAMVDLLTALVRTGAPSDSGWYSTHPAAADRRAAIKSMVEEAAAEASVRGRAARLGRFDRAMQRAAA